VPVLVTDGFVSYKRVSYIDYNVLFDMLHRTLRFCWIVSKFHLLPSITGHLTRVDR
jgi:hypothetical protein